MPHRRIAHFCGASSLAFFSRFDFSLPVSLSFCLLYLMLSMDFCFGLSVYYTSIENRNRKKQPEKLTLKFQRQRKPFKHCALTNCIAFKVDTKKAVWNSKISCSMFIVVLNLHMNELEVLYAMNVRAFLYFLLRFVFWPIWMCCFHFIVFIMVLVLFIFFLRKKFTHLCSGVCEWMSVCVCVYVHMLRNECTYI